MEEYTSTDTADARRKDNNCTCMYVCTYLKATDWDTCKTAELNSNNHRGHIEERAHREAVIATYVSTVHTYERTHV